MSGITHMNLPVVALALVLSTIPCFGGTAAGDDIPRLLKEGMERIHVSRGDTSLYVLTDASYVIRNGKTTERYLDVIMEATGCSPGKGNLLLFHRPATDPLTIALFNKTNRECAVVDADGVRASIRGPVSLAFERLNDDAAWKEIQAAAGPSESFAITGIFHQWAAGAPYDFMKCAELHNHLCPGITSGYFIAKYIQKFHPIGRDDSYAYISCPPWCKDDGIQMMMDLTPGKHGMYVKALSEEQKKRIADPNAAGIMLLRQGKNAGATALILSYDHSAANELSGSNKFTGLQAKFAALTGLIPFYHTPERFVKVAKTVEMTAAAADSLGRAGINPYEVLGFVK